MSNEDSRANRNCPTENGISGRPNGWDDTPETNCSRKTLPREDATAQTRGCAGTDPHPVESSAREENNLSGAIAGVLERLENGQVAREFDEVEDSQPDLEISEGKPAFGGQRYRVEGETDEKWVETGYVIAVGGTGR
ncbi:hypothetical protein [Natronococcus jeotgali]|uniref:Uncharacterized protein n=1 Tax=Natronococcus jeotgali DSM 18795 TaxID=1227498 RepID=L9WXL3_9EURY|nr:hypothetical protein [Natronococcus jeotgali]ELY54214.1 hypothetical protein C492_16593 [Natronococcus jeotgali DSM 18795]